MKKVVLSLAAVALLTVVSCKDANQEAPVEETIEAVEETAVEAVEATEEAATDAVEATEEAVEEVIAE